MSAQIPKTMKAIQVLKTGGPEENKMVEVPVPTPGENQALIKVEWTGVNFIDTYFRTGLYPKPMPYIVGQDAVGTLLSLPPSYKPPAAGYPPLKVGQTVFTTVGPAFADYMVAPIARLVPLPEGVKPEDGVALASTAFTAWALVRETHPVKKGEWVLVRSASGGVGTILVQMCKHLGANIIATVSSQDKVDLAKQNGADHVLLSTAPSEENVQKVMELTGGEGCHVVYDGVGKDTFEENFEVIRRKGMMALFGNASGAPPMMSPLRLSAKSLKMSRPKFDSIVSTAEEFGVAAKEIFEWVKDGTIKFYIHKVYPFSEEGVIDAQNDITSRKTTGKLVIRVA